jgi:hypothetical protein
MPAASGLQSEPGPINFLLFGCVKGKPSNYKSRSQENLFNAITEVFTGVHQEVWLGVFEFWYTG